MNDIDNAVERMIAAILDSEAYREYDLQRNKVNQQPVLKDQINEFRRRNYELQNSSDYSSFGLFEHFEQEYEEFKQKPLVADFLAAELAFCRLMQDINIKITESLNFE